MMKILLTYLLAACTITQSHSQQSSEDTTGRGLSFSPDITFKGSSLSSWKKLGDGDWTAKDGEITGRTKGATAAWLMLDHSFQDIAINTLIKISPGSEAGILLRAEKKGDHITGVLVSIKNDSIGAYAVTIDGQGRLQTRHRLRPAGGMIRMAPAPDPGQEAKIASWGQRRHNEEGPELPVKRPTSAWKPGEWNQLELILDLNLLRAYINDGNGPGGAVDSAAFGNIALYAGGTGEIHYKDLHYKDLAQRTLPAESNGKRWKPQRISDMYYSWSAAAADFNRDGVLDVIAGPYIYFGPDYTTFREIYPAFAINPSKEFTDVNCQYTFDFNGDGWPDVFVGPPFGRLYINPAGQSRRWDMYNVIPGNINTEVTVFTDIDGDKRPELVYGSNQPAGGVIKYAKFNPADPTQPWEVHTVSAPGYFMAHGIGAGDINGDGRVDILNPNGWWEQPATLTDAPWTYHPVAFGRFGHRIGGAGGSVMAVYDVNGDHLNDVVTSLNAHGFGLAWFEQQRTTDGKISFIRHMIMDDYSTKNAGGVTFSELHGSTYADINNDGIPDFIVGKRFFSHVDTYLDPDPFSAPVLYVYRTVRDPHAPGGAYFVPELVHNRSGAGSDVLAVDLNKDGAMDIISSTDRGTFIFWNNKK